MKNSNKKFKIGTRYVFDGKTYKVLDRGSDVMIIAPMKGCICYKKDQQMKKIVINMATKVEQTKMSRGVYTEIWLKASDLK